MGKQKKKLKTDIELEIRIWLKNPDFLIQWLKKRATLIKTSRQKDIYFDHPNRSFVFTDSQGLKDADEWLRLRITDNGNSLCYKKWHRNRKTGASFYADEIETPIKESRKIIDILKKLGFRQIAIVEKYRESWKYKDFEIDCDRVRKLGYFVEIEYKGKLGNPKKGKEKIFLLLDKIEIKNWKLIDRGYPWMLWNPSKW